VRRKKREKRVWKPSSAGSRASRSTSEIMRVTPSRRGHQGEQQTASVALSGSHHTARGSDRQQPAL
jgi:hypothetical protein